jgi:hypothetical protein
MHAWQMLYHLSCAPSLFGSFVYFLVVLGFEFTTLYLLDRHSTTWATSPALFYFIFQVVLHFFLGLASGHSLPTYVLTHTWVYGSNLFFLTLAVREMVKHMGPSGPSAYFLTLPIASMWPLQAVTLSFSLPTCDMGGGDVWEGQILYSWSAWQC